MDEKINIEFTGGQFDEILKYQKLVEAKTVQDAIMNALSTAFDEKDG